VFLIARIFTREELRRYSKKFRCGIYIMANGDMNNSVRAFEVFFKILVQKHMKGRLLDIKQQTRSSKTSYKMGMLKDIL